MERLVAQDEEADSVQRSAICLVILMRYIKRVASHLKNVCSAVVNPFHQIGFRPGV